MDSPLQTAIDLAGGPAALAQRLNAQRCPAQSPVLPQHVVNWRRRRLPGEWCRQVEAAVDGRVTRYQLRPDVFGHPPVVRAAHAPAGASAPVVPAEKAA